MHLSKVDIGEEGLVALLDLYGILSFFVDAIVSLSVCTIDHELLGNAVGLNHDVFNVEMVLRDGKRVPAFTFIP